MALPLIGIGGAIATAIRTVSGWFGKGGAISTFFTWLGIKFTTKAMAVAWQIATMIALFASRVAFCYAVYDFSKTIINYINYFLDQLPTLLTSTETLSIAYNLMIAIGLIDAVNDAFAIFDITLSALLLAFLAKIAYHTLKMSSDEYFKLSVLLQQ